MNKLKQEIMAEVEKLIDEKLKKEEVESLIDERLRKEKEIIAGVERLKKKKEWPQVGDTYYAINYNNARSLSFSYDGEDIDQERKEAGNLFRNRKEADMYALRIKSMKHKFLPKVGEEYWTALPYSGTTTNPIWANDDDDKVYYNQGQTFRTQEEAEQWLKDFKDAWLYLPEEE